MPERYGITVIRWVSSAQRNAMPWWWTAPTGR